MANLWDKWSDVGDQVILKEDFLNLWNAIAAQPTARMQPVLVRVDNDNVKVEATPDCPVSMALTGMPNILNSATQVSGGLSDGVIRSITAQVTLDLDSDLWGARKISQWYAIFAIAGDTDTDFTLKAMPVMRVLSQTGQAIKTAKNLDKTTGLDYGFTEDELIGSVVYFVSGVSRGLMRVIDGNDLDTYSRISYSGAALSLTQGDWFVILPDTNFRLVGTIYNTSADAILKFVRQGNRVVLLESVITAGGTGVIEVVNGICPFASTALLYPLTASSDLGYWDSSAGAGRMEVMTVRIYTEVPILFGKYYMSITDGAQVLGYKYDPGCGW
jgi:hypothetical protein